MESAGVSQFPGRLNVSWQLLFTGTLVAILYVVRRVRVDVVDEGSPSGAGGALVILPADLSLPWSYSVLPFCILLLPMVSPQLMYLMIILRGFPICCTLLLL